MKEPIESLCSMCVLLALMEQMHAGGRFFGVLRLIMGLKLIHQLIILIQNLL